MIEFNSQVGGRYVYVDDIVNLQNLALSIASIFDDCDNFIISGCQISGNQISSGYVYINGKIRFFNGATGITQWPQYIYENNYNSSVPYANGTEKVGRVIYGCSISQSVPTSLDPITGAIPSYINISQSGGLRLKDALLTKYSLSKDSVTQQTVNGSVNFQDTCNFAKGITSRGKINLLSGNVNANIQIDENNLNIISQVNENINKISITSNGIIFSINGKAICTISNNTIQFIKQTTCPSSLIGYIAIDNNQHIYDKNTPSNEGGVFINFTGYNGGDTYFRNTYIGDGKGSKLLEILGENKEVRSNASVLISTNNNNVLTFKSLLDKSNVNYKQILRWTDNKDVTTAYIGYYDNSKTMNLKNSLGDIVIRGVLSVDLGPEIKENGVPLSEKYVLKDGDGIDATDTGWINITQGLFARQIGNIVCIQGTIRTIHSGVLFTIPNNIAPPKYDTVFCSGDYNVWRTRIKGGQKKCIVEYCSGFCGQTEGFSLTYMI